MAQKPPLIHRLEQERILLLVVFVLVMLAGVNFCRVLCQEGLTADEYWAHKMSWRGCADVVFAGDSRCNYAVNPAVVKQVAPLLARDRVVNFGFNGASLSPEYLDAIRSVLDPDSANPTIVLLVTPLSLSQAKQQANGFAALNAKPRAHYRDYLSQSTIERWLRPLPVRPIARKLMPSKVARPKVYHANGWCARHDPPKTFDAAAAYEVMFSQPEFQHDAGAAESLLNRVKSWIDEGITVVMLRPPTCPQMVRIEDSLSGFGYDNLRWQAEQAGAYWLEMDQFAYESYDGCHLNADGATAFSGDLAQLLAHTRQIATKQRRRETAAILR